MYYFRTTRLTPQIVNEVDRILQDAMRRYGGPEHTVYIIWTPVQTKEGLDRWIPDDIGFYGGGRWHNPPMGVVVTLDDLHKPSMPGMRIGDFQTSINPIKISDDCRDAGQPVGLGLAATIAHEVLLHAVGEKHGHYEDGPGFVDSRDGGQIGKTLSDKAAHNLIDQLDAEGGD